MPVGSRKPSLASRMKAAFEQLIKDTRDAPLLENLRCGETPHSDKVTGDDNKKRNRAATDNFVDVLALARFSVLACRKRRLQMQKEEVDFLSESSMSALARFTDSFALQEYEKFLHYVPRLVNVVTLAEAVPVKGTPKLPLDLQLIATKCSGAFYAPRRFSAVQLAYKHPRARVLVFRAHA